MARRRSPIRRSGQARVSPGAFAAALILVGVVIALAIAAGRGVFNAPGQSAAEDAVSRVEADLGAPSRRAQSVFDRLHQMWTATERVAALEAENRELRAWRVLAERLAERNARYESLLRMPADGFAGGARAGVSAQLVLDSGGPFTRTLVANAGAEHGVGVGDIALNEAGLVGRVVTVGRRSSRILMLDDFNSRVPVMGEASRVRAILRGRASAPPELLTRPFAIETPSLDFIVGSQSLREGERIITSGDGGIFPRGLMVGLARRTAAQGWRVAPAASQQSTDFVRLVPYTRTPAPEGEPAAAPSPSASAQATTPQGLQTAAQSEQRPAQSASAPRPSQPPRQSATTAAASTPLAPTSTPTPTTEPATPAASAPQAAPNP